jgi:chromosome segregation ATPase
VIYCSEEKERLQQAIENFQMNYVDLAEEHKTVIKQLQDADKQLVTSMQKIKSLNWDKERKKKELDELETAAHALVEVVDPTVNRRTLLEHLRDAL